MKSEECNMPQGFFSCQLTSAFPRTLVTSDMYAFMSAF